MGLGRDRTRDPWNCSQTHICRQTRGPVVVVEDKVVVEDFKFPKRCVDELSQKMCRRIVLSTSCLVPERTSPIRGA